MIMTWFDFLKSNRLHGGYGVPIGGGGRRKVLKSELP